MGAGAAVVIALGLRAMSLGQFVTATLESMPRDGDDLRGHHRGGTLHQLHQLRRPARRAGRVVVLDRDLPVWVVMAFIVIVYLVLGCVLESLSMILLTVPVFYPLMYLLPFENSASAEPRERADLVRHRRRRRRPRSA
jgi:hypothetical protein